MSPPPNNNYISNQLKGPLFEDSRLIKKREQKLFKKCTKIVSGWKDSQQKKKDSAKQKRDAKTAKVETADDEEDDDDVIEVDPNADVSNNKENHQSDQDDDEVQEVSP